MNSFFDMRTSKPRDKKYNNDMGNYNCCGRRNSIDSSHNMAVQEQLLLWQLKCLSIIIVYAEWTSRKSTSGTLDSFSFPVHFFSHASRFRAETNATPISFFLFFLFFSTEKLCVTWIRLVRQTDGRSEPASGSEMQTECQLRVGSHL